MCHFLYKKAGLGIVHYDEITHFCLYGRPCQLNKVDNFDMLNSIMSHKMSWQSLLATTVQNK